jgi:hypothetical protein
MKPHKIFHLSKSRQADLVNINPINYELLVECAYYPTPLCRECQFDRPNDKCQRSHILVDTRINPPKYSSVVNKRKPKVKRKFSLLMLEGLSDWEIEEISKLIQIQERRTK